MPAGSPFVCKKRWSYRLDFLRLALFPILIALHGALVPSAIEGNTPIADLSEQPRIPLANTPTVRDYVRRAAERSGVNPNRADWIVAHESHYGSSMRGDHGQSRGYWMISSIYHPEVSTMCADDLECSTQWALGRIRAGFVNEWSSWRFRCQSYANSPECPTAEIEAACCEIAVSP